MTTRDAFDPLVDHHCHGLFLRQLDRAQFESFLNEASGPWQWGTSLFDSMLGLAVRRWCAPVLDLDPLASPDDYLECRRAMGPVQVAQRFLQAAGISEFLVDTGFDPGGLCSPAELAHLGGGRPHEIIRLETLTQEMLAAGTRPRGVPSRVEAALHATTAVGVKSIAAYRVGLSLPGVRPTDGKLVEALAEVHPDATGAFRIAHPVVHAWLAWAAIDANLPVQFHVGYGDSDLDLLQCDPLRLTPFLRATQDRAVPVLLLHNYPFHRHAAYLAQVFDHVFMDVGLATHNAGALSGAILRESLELAPFGKMMFSSDACALAELYYLGALLFRRGLSGVLEPLVAAGEMSAADASHATALIGSKNATRVYGLADNAIG